VRRLKKGTTDDSQRPVNRLASLTFLQQILGGFAPGAIMDVVDPLDTPPGRPIFDTPEKNPRIATMLEDIEDFPDTSKFIIWSRFTYEIEAITDALRAAYGPQAAVAYYGAISRDARELAIDRFQGDPSCRFFVGNPQAGGTGLTLTAASTVIYYSNSFNLEHRLQSEDRAHRIGQTNKVLYIDYECEGTIDTKIIDTLKAKKSVADLITGDAFNNWLE
jgi:SNF2 family DNA or RNA helicase